jgi:hypothetical protein
MPVKRCAKKNSPYLFETRGLIAVTGRYRLLTALGKKAI